MYVYLKNINELHYIENYLYVIKKNGGIEKVDKEKEEILKLLYKNINDFEQIIDILYLKEKNIEKSKIRYSVNQSIGKMKDIIEISFSSKKYFQNKIMLTGEKEKSFPISVQIALTNRCLHKCKHCFINASKNGKEINKLTLEKILNYLKQKTINIEFTGGEPFLYTELEDIIEKYETDFKFSVTTSGYWGKKYNSNFLKKFDLIQLSLYGYSEHEHNQFVGVKESFTDVMKNIHKIMDANINLIVQTQARNNDIEEMRKFIVLCIQEGIKNIMIGVISPIGRAKKMKIWENYNIDIIQNNIKKLKEEFKNIINIIFFDEQYKMVCHSSNFFSCKAGKIKWYITETGIIMPCALVDRNIFSMGNIDNNDHINLVEKNMYMDIQNRWYSEREKIKKIYLNQGIQLEDICDRI